MEVSSIDSKYQHEFDDVSNWIKFQYDNLFSEYFEEMHELYARLASSTKPITDDELETILSTIPLRLYGAAERLNDLKVRIEVIKLHIKKDKHDCLVNSEASSQTSKREEATFSVIEDELLLKVYSSLIERVEGEISASKELIMSAKKIWTSRREAENIGNAAKDVNLPDYTNLDEKQYIK